jgi:hypothetical protein
MESGLGSYMDKTSRFLPDISVEIVSELIKDNANFVFRCRPVEEPQNPNNAARDAMVGGFGFSIRQLAWEGPKGLHFLAKPRSS